MISVLFFTSNFSMYLVKYWGNWMCCLAPCSRNFSISGTGILSLYMVVICNVGLTPRSIEGYRLPSVTLRSYRVFNSPKWCTWRFHVFGVFSDNSYKDIKLDFWHGCDCLGLVLKIQSFFSQIFTSFQVWKVFKYEL